MPEGTPPGRSRSGALAVGAGIFLSRIAGFIRDRAIAHYLGIRPEAGIFRAAMRVPNFLQNLLGEGVLSASFIPVYARLRAEGRHDDADQVARAVGTLLALLASTIAVVGIAAAGPLGDLLAPGFSPDSRELTSDLIRILFPGVAMLVMAAWCLGVLNSHRRFFLPYVAPVLWNAAQIATMIAAGRHFAGHDGEIVRWLGYGVVIGSAAQLLVQLPSALRLLRSVRPSLALGDPGVRQTIRASGPVLLGRGSYQLSAFVDQAIASFLGESTVAAMFNAQTLSMLPVSLFGMAVSAAELPEMSSATGTAEERGALLRERLRISLRRVVYLVVPSAVALVAIGGPIVALLYQSGRFGASDVREVWIIVAGSAFGLSAGTQGRLLSSAFYALQETRPPLYAALVRVAITGITGWAIAMPLREAFAYAPVWGAFGLTASAGVAAWIEFLLLKRMLAARIGDVPVPVRLGLGALAAATVAGALGYGAWWLATQVTAHVVVQSIVAIAVYSAVYLAITIGAGIPESRDLVRRVPGLRRLVR